MKIYIWPLGKRNDTYIQNLQQLGVEKISYDNTAKIYYAETLPSKINSILNLKWVRKIDFQKEASLHSLPAKGFEPDDSRELINAPSIWSSYTGNNVTMGVLDTGIWNGHPDFTGGVIHSIPDPDGHGTHVSGIIASRGTRDIEGQYDGKGVAYGSSLYVLDDIGNLSQFNVFKNNGVKIVSNSWGYCDDSNCITWNYSYDGRTEIVDSYVENDGMTIIFSAGNEGSGQRTITNPGTAKNVITVGAISYTIEGVSGGVGKVAGYSSRGPTRTSGRLKPDVVAPGGDLGSGYYKYGVVSTNAQDGNGSWLDDVPDRWPTDSYYTRMVGTSMAAPHVSGVIALINETYRNNSFSDGLLPRDYKALLIGDAIPLKGYGTNASNGYANTDVGYGLIDAYFSISDRAGEKQTPLWGHGEVIETISNTQDWNINVSGTEKKLAIVLAYEDNEGQIDETHVLKDDLDLRIISPGGTEFNYTLPAGVTSEGPEEKIVIDNPSNYGSGTWTIRVEGASWDNWLNPFESQKYTVVVNAYYVEPSIVIEAPDVINVKSGGNFTLSPTIGNIGGLTAAGVTVNVSTNASGFGGDINNETFVGNLVGNGSSKSASYNITVPLTVGEYQINISANGINHDLNKPNDKTVTVSVGFLSGWSNRKQKNITGSTAGAQTNYQMKLTVYNSSGTDAPGIVYLGGNAKSDFGDLRFTKSDGVTLLDYWIESYTSGVSAVVWVEVDSIPASPNTASIYVYYGNPSAASASNGDTTFAFFDDFPGTSLNTNKWTYSGSVSVSGGKVSLGTALTGIYTGLNYNINSIMRSKEKRYQPAGSDGNHETQSSFQISTQVNSWDSSDHVTGYSYDASGQGFGLMTKKAGNAYAGSRTNLFDGGANWHISEITWSDNLTEWKWDGSVIDSHTDTTKIPIVTLRVSFGTYAHLQELDWVLVRKYASPEPAWDSP